MATEVKWTCGCHEVDGELVAECTQVAPSGEIPAEHHGPVKKPYSPKCSRLAALPGPVLPQAHAGKEKKAAKVADAPEGKFDDHPAPDAETRAEEAADEVDEAVAEEAADHPGVHPGGRGKPWERK